MTYFYLFSLLVVNCLFVWFFQKEVPVRDLAVWEHLVHRDLENTSRAGNSTVIISRQTPSACSKGASQPQSPVSKWKARRSQLKDPETPLWDKQCRDQESQWVLRQTGLPWPRHWEEQKLTLCAVQQSGGSRVSAYCTLKKERPLWIMTHYEDSEIGWHDNACKWNH